MLDEVRFTSLKKHKLEANGSRLEKSLLEECKHAEEKNYVPTSLHQLLFKQVFVHTGLLTVKVLVKVLFFSQEVNLSRLQVHILLSAAELIGSDRMVDYYR